MTDREARERWERMARLMQPVHEPALATARHLCRSASEGDDLYHDTVLRAFEKLPTLRDESRFRSWFFAVLLSVHRSRCRRGFWRRFLPLDETPEAAERTGEDRTAEDSAGMRRAVLALSRLPAAQREALVLHALEGFSMEEIAAVQDVSVAAVKSRVLRARARVRDTYRRHGWAPVGAHPESAAGPLLGALAFSGAVSPHDSSASGGGHARRS